MPQTPFFAAQFDKEAKKRRPFAVANGRLNFA
jgi:hypothetical protein